VGVTLKQKIGSVVIAIILACTVICVAGIWGMIGDDQAWKIFWTLLACAAGLGTSATLLDVYFKDKTE